MENSSRGVNIRLLYLPPANTYECQEAKVRTRHQIAYIHWVTEKAREFQKNIICFIDYAKAFNCVDHNKLWKILKRREYQTTLPASREICMQVRKQ